MLTVHRFETFISFPSRRTWGECWWTARDICITNEPELPDVFQIFSDAFYTRLFNEFVFGSADGPPK